MQTLSDIATMTEQEKQMEELLENSHDLLKHTVVNIDGIRASDLVLFKNNYEIITTEELTSFSLIKNDGQDNKKFSVSIIEALGKGVFTLYFDTEEEAIEQYKDFCERSIEQYKESSERLMEDISNVTLQEIR